MVRKPSSPAVDAPRHAPRSPRHTEWLRLTSLSRCCCTTRARSTKDAFGASYAEFASICMFLGAVCILIAFCISKNCISCCGLNGKDQPKVMCPIFVACEPCLCPPEKPKVEEQQV